VIGEYRALGCRFRWTVDPGSAPGDLAARLARRGLALTWTHGMARATAAAEAAPPAGVAISRVDRADVDAYTQTMAAGWGLDPGPLARANDLAIHAAESRHRLFLARVAGVPAGTAAYVAFPRSAYLLGAVVLPPWRGRGIYRALVAARLRDARAAGLALATSHARATSSAPILESLGFHSMCRFPVLSG
jgi:GNAT superfamily N-acetyltransferase